MDTESEQLNFNVVSKSINEESMEKLREAGRQPKERKIPSETKGSDRLKLTLRHTENPREVTSQERRR